MLGKRVVTLLTITAAFVMALAQPSAADSVVVPIGQFAPLTESPSFKLYGLGEGLEWVPGEESRWIAGVDLPPRAQLRALNVFCLDNVESNAVVQLVRVKGDGSPPVEIQTVVTGGSRKEPGTGYTASENLRTEDRVDRHHYQYFVRILLPPKPDDVRGILRINAVEVVFER